MSEPAQGQGGCRSRATGLGALRPSPLACLASPVPTGRPLPHPRSPPPRLHPPAERQADQRGQPRVTAAAGSLPSTWSDMVTVASPGGLRTAAASGRYNLALRFTNPSPFPTAQHRGCRDFRLRFASLPPRARRRTEEKRKREAGKRTGEGSEGRRALEAAWRWWGEEGTTVSSSARRSGP
jgi:hypothetical protein